MEVISVATPEPKPRRGRSGRARGARGQKQGGKGGPRIVLSVIGGTSNNSPAVQVSLAIRYYKAYSVAGKRAHTSTAGEARYILFSVSNYTGRPVFKIIEGGGMEFSHTETWNLIFGILYLLHTVNTVGTAPTLALLSRSHRMPLKMPLKKRGTKDINIGTRSY